MYTPVETVRTVDGRRLHRFQVVRERRGDTADEEWVIVGFTESGVRLADPAFERTKEVPSRAVGDGRFEPVAAAGVPVWGY